MDTIRVLVVDSDPTSRSLHQAVLRQLAKDIAFVFVEADSSITGTELFRSQGPFDLLVTGGLFRQGEPGVQFAQQLRISHPDLHVILLSTDIDCVASAASVGFGAMSKPYNQDDFVACVRRLISTATAFVA